MHRSTYETLEVTKTNHIATVVFNRPDCLNALTIKAMQEICDLADSLTHDEATRVVIFTGNGRHFCGGLDLADAERLQQFESDSRLMKLRHMKLGPEMIRKIFEIDQITIAAINGAAMGGGACIASACDFRIGESNSRIGFPEVNLAMNLSWVALPLLVHLIGPSRAKRMVILADRLDAATMQQWGYLDKVVSRESLLNEAMKMAERYAAQAPVAAQMVKRSVNAISSALDRAIMHMDSDQFLYAVSGSDFKEGVQAFLEKRKPEFKGD